MKIARIVRSYVTVNLFLAVLAGVFTWLALELLGVDLAVPLGVLVAILDLVPLIGFTVGGLLVAVVAALHDFPTALLIWVALFIVYQQLQDRVIQPIFYKSAVRIQPAVAVLVVLAGRPARRHPRRPAGDPDRGGARGDLRRALAPQARRRSGRRRGRTRARGRGLRLGRGRRRGRPRGGPRVRVAVAARAACARPCRRAAPRASAASPAGTRARRRPARRSARPSAHQSFCLIALTAATPIPTSAEGADARRRPCPRPSPRASTQELKPTSSTPAAQPAMIIASIDFRPSFSQ